MLEAINLGCIRGDRRLFRGLNFKLPEGGLLELRGPNGSGKTSLLRILCGLAEPVEGEVRWNGADIRRLREDYFASIAYVGHQNAVKDELTAFENLIAANRLRGNPLTRKEAEGTLERVGLANQQRLAARFLSAGQRRRLALARLAASGSSVWILDEIFSSLDDSGAKLASQLIKDHLKENGSAIVATHQPLDLSAGAGQTIDLASLSDKKAGPALSQPT